MKRLALAFSALMLIVSGGVSFAQTAPADAGDVLQRMIARNAGLSSYSARVHVQTHTNIPFYSPALEGTAYYKRPGSFAVIFDRVPGYLKGFQQIFTDAGDPAQWERDSNIKLAGTVPLDGRPMLELVMTKKIYSDQITNTIAYVDPDTYELVEIDWHYTNGDAIVLKQYYTSENGFNLVARQHVDAHRRMLRGTADSVYDAYQTNVAFSDAVFAKQP